MPRNTSCTWPRARRRGPRAGGGHHEDQKRTKVEQLHVVRDLYVLYVLFAQLDLRRKTHLVALYQAHSPSELITLLPGTSELLLASLVWRQGQWIVHLVAAVARRFPPTACLASRSRGALSNSARYVRITYLAEKHHETRNHQELHLLQVGATCPSILGPSTPCATSRLEGNALLLASTNPSNACCIIVAAGALTNAGANAGLLSEGAATGLAVGGPCRGGDSTKIHLSCCKHYQEWCELMKKPQPCNLVFGCNWIV